MSVITKYQRKSSWQRDGAVKSSLEFSGRRREGERETEGVINPANVFEKITRKGNLQTKKGIKLCHFEKKKLFFQIKKKWSLAFGPQGVTMTIGNQ